MDKSSTLTEMATWTRSLSVVNPYSDKSPATTAAVPAHVESLNKCRYLPLATSHCQAFSNRVAASGRLLPHPLTLYGLQHLQGQRSMALWHSWGHRPSRERIQTSKFSILWLLGMMWSLKVSPLFIRTPRELPCLIPIFIGPQSNIWRNLVTYLVNDWREVIVSESAWSHCPNGSKVPVSVGVRKKK